jgi:hypothetical protein
MRKPPLRDQHGKIVPHDHPEILDEHHVIRHTVSQDLCPDEDGKRLSSGAFSESTGGGMSVDIEDWMKVDGLDPLHYVTDPTHGAVRLKVGDLRKLGLKVGWDPDDANRHHGAVWGIGNGSKRRRRVLEIATTVRRLEGETVLLAPRSTLSQAEPETAHSASSVADTEIKTVPIYAVDGTITLYDIYVVTEGVCTWIGSRRTLSQCQDAFDAHRGHKITPRK